MTEMFRSCPGCGSDQVFLQPHPGPGQCPDAPDRTCAEWFCARCGTALLVDVAAPHSAVPSAAVAGEPGGDRPGALMPAT